MHMRIITSIITKITLKYQVVVSYTIIFHILAMAVRQQRAWTNQNQLTYGRTDGRRYICCLHNIDTGQESHNCISQT